MQDELDEALDVGPRDAETLVAPVGVAAAALGVGVAVALRPGRVSRLLRSCCAFGITRRLTWITRRVVSYVSLPVSRSRAA